MNVKAGVRGLRNLKENVDGVKDEVQLFGDIGGFLDGLLDLVEEEDEKESSNGARAEGKKTEKACSREAEAVASPELIALTAARENDRDLQDREDLDIVSRLLRERGTVESALVGQHLFGVASKELRERPSTASALSRPSTAPFSFSAAPVSPSKERRSQAPDVLKLDDDELDECRVNEKTEGKVLRKWSSDDLEVSDGENDGDESTVLGPTFASPALFYRGNIRRLKAALDTAATARGAEDEESEDETTKRHTTATQRVPPSPRTAQQRVLGRTSSTGSRVSSAASSSSADSGGEAAMAPSLSVARNRTRELRASISREGEWRQPFLETRPRTAAGALQSRAGTGFWQSSADLVRAPANGQPRLEEGVSIDVERGGNTATKPPLPKEGQLRRPRRRVDL